MNNKPKISVIIPCFNAEKYIYNCLTSVLASDCNNYEIVVVNNGSTDASTKIISSFSKKNKVRAINLYPNIGPTKARNTGAKIATGKYLLFLDADTLIKPDCLPKIVSEFEVNANLGAVQCQLLKGEGEKLDGIGHFLSFTGFPYEVGVDENPKNYQDRKNIFGAKTAAVAVKREVFKKIGCFDEDYFMHGEDTDLSWRIWLAGFQIIYLPTASAYHFGKSSLNAKSLSQLYYQGPKNNTNYLIKNMPLKILVFVLPIHIICWSIIGIKQFFKGRPEFAKNIIRGLCWNMINLKKTITKRGKGKIEYKIIFGKENFYSLFKKGLSWFKSV